MSRPRKVVPREEALTHTAVRMPQWLKDQVELIGNVYPDKKTFTDRLIFVVQQGIDKIVKDREKTTYDRIEAMVARTEDMVLTVLANQVLLMDEELPREDVEEQKAVIEEEIRKRRLGRVNKTQQETSEGAGG